MRNPATSRHRIIFRDPHAYAAHPHAVSAGGRWLVVFNLAPRRAFTMHPPEDPFYRNVLIRSDDQGETWSAPEVVPDFATSGTECAGLTVLRDGAVLLNQWQFDWLPLGRARAQPDRPGLVWPETFLAGWRESPEHDVSAWRDTPADQLAPWVRAGGRTLTHLSTDGGMSFAHSATIDTGPYSGGYGMRGGVQFDDGAILLPLSDVPAYVSVFGVVSQDGGRSWQAPFGIAAGAGHAFEEPTIVAAPSGRLILVLRDNVTRRLHQCESDDRGATWSAPRALPIEGYPAHLLVLRDGRLLLTYGWRYPDFGVRAVLSADEGRTWATDDTIRVIGGLPSKNLGYPSTVEAPDGTLFSVYYGEDEAGTTCIMGTHWTP